MDDEILTVREVAAYLKIKEKTAYRLAAEGKIPGFKVGGSWRFRQQDIESWIEAQSADITVDEKRERKD
jgi:excisionase family DNA binding protein